MNAERVGGRLPPLSTLLTERRLAARSATTCGAERIKKGAGASILVPTHHHIARVGLGAPPAGWFLVSRAAAERATMRAAAFLRRPAALLLRFATSLLLARGGARARARRRCDAATASAFSSAVGCVAAVVVWWWSAGWRRLEEETGGRCVNTASSCCCCLPQDAFLKEAGRAASSGCFGCVVRPSSRAHVIRAWRPGLGGFAHLLAYFRAVI
jgi:hypothetical protein